MTDAIIDSLLALIVCGAIAAIGLTAAGLGFGLGVGLTVLFEGWAA